MPSSALTSQSLICNGGKIGWLNINSTLTSCLCGCFIKPNYGPAGPSAISHLAPILTRRWALSNLFASVLLANDQSCSNYLLSLNWEIKALPGLPPLKRELRIYINHQTGFSQQQLLHHAFSQAYQWQGCQAKTTLLKPLVAGGWIQVFSYGAKNCGSRKPRIHLQVA